MKNQRRKTPKTEKQGETRKKNQKMGVHRKKQGKHRTYNRAKETIQKKKKKKQGREREHTGKNEHKREPSFFPVSSQRNRGGHKEKATSREPEERETEQERRGSKTEGEGNEIGGRRQRPEVLHRVSASLRPGKPFFSFRFLCFI